MMRLMSYARRWWVLLSMVSLLVPVGLDPVRAHPHIWIDLRSAVLFDESGKVSGLRVHWMFDEFYTIFATEGLEAGGDGVPTDKGLRLLADLSIKNLEEYSYFTFAKADGAAVAYGAVTEYEAYLWEDRLVLVFTLPFAELLDPSAVNLSYSIYDPTYYIEVLHVREEPVLLEGAALADCRTAVLEPNPGAEAVSLAASLDRTQTAGDGLGELFAEQVSLLCD